MKVHNKPPEGLVTVIQCNKTEEQNYCSQLLSLNPQKMTR